jgi:putative peptidoglycan lipid II flippase
VTERTFRPLPPAIVFLLFFSYATAAALLFQKFLLPLVASAHHGQGLVEGDSAYFHAVAVDLAERIRLHGWSEWRVYPTHAATGNVALLAGLYVLFGEDPSLMVPVNAAIHALTGTLLFLLGRMMWPGRAGTLAGMIAGMLYVVFPSALNWYGQIHKDGFALAGTALVLTAWVIAETGFPMLKRALAVIAVALAGLGLIVLVRPYNLMLVLAGVLVMLVFTLGSIWKNRKSLAFRRTLFLQLTIVLMVGAAAYMAPRTGAFEQSYAEWNKSTETWGRGERIAIDWKWQSTAWMPQTIEGYVEVLARTRAGLIDEGLKIQAGSLYDIDALPSSTPQVAAYAPRGLQIALFAPFPSLWFEKLSATRLVAVGETAIWYLIAPGVLLALWLARTRAVLAVLAFSLALLTVYGFTLANVGTLYRIRYLYLFLLMLVGLGGWLRLFEKRGWLPKEEEAIATRVPEEPAAGGELRQARAGLVGSGATVAVVTAVTFFGLFIRDIVMARQFGLGGELDAFVVAAVVPMFLVAVLSVPIGTSIVPVFLAVRERESTAAALALARRVAILFLAAALVLAVLLAAAGPQLLEAAGWSALPEKADRTQAIMLWMLAIFVFSGLVTLANGLLNALGHYVVPAAAQAVVPIVAIVALLLFGASHGAIVAAVAMFAGQLVNLALVFRALAVRGVSLLPAQAAAVKTGLFVSQYLPLVAAAAFMQLTVPVSTAMASVLPEGSVAALGLGSKAVLFATGLIGAAIASVVLPYFSRYMAQNRLLDARRELSFLLLAGTVITIPVTLALHLLSESFVRLAFEGGAFGSAEVGIVSRVMANGILQLPFYVVSVLLLKFAIATRHSGRVMLAAGIGLVANILLNLVLMERLGAPGIALSMTLAAALAAGLMLLLFCRLGDVAWVDMVFISTNWVLFLALTVCLHYASYAGAVAAGIAFLFLVLGEWAMTFKFRPAQAVST